MKRLLLFLCCILCIGCDESIRANPSGIIISKRIDDGTMLYPAGKIVVPEHYTNYILVIKTKHNITYDLKCSIEEYNKWNPGDKWIQK